MLQIQTQTRELFGKKSDALREKGLIPAEIYGRGKENLHVTILEKDFNKTLKEAGESSIVELIADGSTHPVLIHDVQRDPISDRVRHVDFYEVRMDEKVRTEVAIEFVGEAPAVKAYGGILVHAMEEIEVEALPADLPQHFTVDVSGLTELNQSIYIKDMTIPKGVKIFADPETVIASITEQQVEAVVETPPADAVPVEGEEAPPAEGAPVEEKKEQ